MAVSLRHLWRIAPLIIVGLSVAGCLSPSYTYVADSSDNAYFKVPPSWHEVSPSSLAAVQGESGSQGTYLWSRAYDASSSPSVQHVFATSPKPVAYAGVLALSSTQRADVSFNSMRDLLLPVTSAARSAASAVHSEYPGFQSISDETITDGHHDRGIREIFNYDLGQIPIPETFDLTVFTNSDTTKIYFLLVHCMTTSFVSDYPEIEKVVGSFTVGGGS
jgi:hypothetical protein